MRDNLLDQSPKSNGDAEPQWLVIHYPVDPRRHRWGEQVADLAEDLVAHGWVIWREGPEAHVKHRAMMTN